MHQGSFNVNTAPEDRLKAWFDGSATCVIAIGSHGDLLDLGDVEIEEFIRRLQACLRESRGLEQQK